MCFALSVHFSRVAIILTEHTHTKKHKDTHTHFNTTQRHLRVSAGRLLNSICPVQVTSLVTQRENGEKEEDSEEEEESETDPIYLWCGVRTFVCVPIWFKRKTIFIQLEGYLCDDVGEKCLSSDWILRVRLKSNENSWTGRSRERGKAGEKARTRNADRDVRTKQKISSNF